MALNLSELDRAVVAELDRLRESIATTIEPILQVEPSTRDKIAHDIAHAYREWQASTNNGTTAARYQIMDFWPKICCEPAIESAEYVRQGIWRVKDIDNSSALTLRDRIEARGYTVNQLNDLLNIVDETMAEIAAEAGEILEAWKAQKPGNRPQPMSYLRLAIDRCLTDLDLSMNRRARTIAGVVVALGLVESKREDAERKSINDFLRKI